VADLQNDLHSYQDGLFRYKIAAFNEDAVREAILSWAGPNRRSGYRAPAKMRGGRDDRKSNGAIRGQFRCNSGAICTDKPQWNQ
jgi:hypothetical protein